MTQETLKRKVVETLTLNDYTLFGFEVSKDKDCICIFTSQIAKDLFIVGQILTELYQEHNLSWYPEFAPASNINKWIIYFPEIEFDVN